MAEKHWQDWTNVALGLWILFSPSVLQHVMSAAEMTVNNTAAGEAAQGVVGNAVIVGATVVALANRAIGTASAEILSRL